MKSTMAVLKLVLIFGVLGGSIFALYHYGIDKNSDESSPTKECKVEKAMVVKSIEAAAKERQRTGLDLVDPATYIDASVTLKYYNWAPGGFSWVTQPIGTPPC